MQINNNYNLHQNTSGRQTHTHHITECMHGEEVRKREGDMGNKSANNAMDTYQRGDAAKEAVEYVASFSVVDKNFGDKKIGKKGLKGYWDSLGEDGEEIFDFKKNISDGVHLAVVTVQGVFADKVIKRFAAVKDRIKTMPAAFKKRFAKKEEAFNALTKENAGFKQHEKEKAPGKKNETVELLKPTGEHLMDSYNKTGGYCQIQENLTYQKPKAVQGIQKSETAE